MRAVLTLAIKDLRLLVRDRAGLFFTLVFPVLMAVFFGMVFSGGGGNAGIDVALVDLDLTPRSQRLVRDLSEAPELNAILRTRDDPPQPLSLEQARQLVRRGRATAYIAVPKGFGREDQSVFFAPDRSIELGVDPSRRAEIGLLEGVLTRHTFSELSSVMGDPALMRSELKRSRQLFESSAEVDPARKMLLSAMMGSIDLFVADLEGRPGTDADPAQAGAGPFAPVRINRTEVSASREGPANSFAVTFSQGILWGVAGCAASFGLTLVVERARGTLVRLRTAPLAWWQIIAGKTLACFLATLAVSGLLLLIAGLAFNVRPVAPLTLAAAVLCLAFCFVGIMMMLAVIGRTEASAGSIGWAVTLVLMMIGGGCVPVFFMPAWMQRLSIISPVRWGILAVEGGLWRDYSMAEMLLPCGVLLGVGALGLLVGVRLFSWSEQR